MIVGVARESFPGERRVAITPAVIGALQKAAHQVLIEPGAGVSAGFSDDQYRDRGAALSQSRAALFGAADIICQVRTLGANPKAGREDLPLLRSGQVVIGLADPLEDLAPTQALAERGVRLFALELLPRVTRAQSMDVLSSQATVAGYKAVMLAAGLLPRMYPMMMTAAGTIPPARVLVIGAGVAGLQAIASAKRNGAVVTAYDIRPVVKEQVESLGARFLQIALEAGGSQDKGGYATAMDDEFYRRQREMMARAVAESDVVITTAAVPGKKSPVLVTRQMVESMRAGSVIIDLAAERGGNCELTRADETIVHQAVTIAGPTNLAATVPYDASQMYARNMAAFLAHISKDGKLVLDPSDEIAQQTLLTDGGRVVHRRVLELFGAAGAEDNRAAPAAVP